jgi:arylsulfatase A-like enzyme
MSADQETGEVRARTAPIHFLLLAVWFGLVAGLVEVPWRLGERYFGETWFLFMGRDFLWMTPLANVALFLVPGLVFFGLAWYRPRWASPGLALFLFCGLLAFQVLLLIGHLYLWAMVLLAVGAASQAARFLSNRWDRFRPVVQRTTPWLAGSVLALGVLAVVPPMVTERRELAQLPPPRAGAPNVLLITLDTVRAQSLSLYGYDRPTSPELQRWAKKGVTFRNALSPSSWTLPSHASLFTGHYCHELTAGWREPLGHDCRTLAEALRERGYHTAGFVGNTRFVSEETGLTRGFVHYEDYGHRPGDFVNSATLLSKPLGRPLVRMGLDYYDVPGRKSAEEVNEEFLGWLSGRGGDRPFFAFLNYLDAHDPYLPRTPFEAEFGPPLSGQDQFLMSKWWPVVKQDLGEEYVDAAVRAYDHCIAYLDHHIGRLLDELQRRGALDNTLVIITADHGEQFGEHGCFIHANSLYRQVVHVPLVIVYPGKVPAGTVVKEPVTLRDVPATVMDLLEADPEFPGGSLAACWRSDDAGPGPSPVICSVFPAPEDWAKPDHGTSPLARGTLISLVHEGHYYIRNLVDDTEEVFDLHGDPEDRHDLAATPEGKEVRRQCREALRRLVQQTSHPGA